MALSGANPTNKRHPTNIMRINEKLNSIVEVNSSLVSSDSNVLLEVNARNNFTQAP